MKKVQAIQNLIDSLTENNFLNLYFVADFETDKRLSLCFLKKGDALEHLQWMVKSNHYPNVKKFYIAETCVYCA